MSARKHEKRQAGLPASEAKETEQKPNEPLEPLDGTQPEIPKVGTTDAPGG